MYLPKRSKLKGKNVDLGNMNLEKEFMGNEDRDKERGIVISRAEN